MNVLTKETGRSNVIEKRVTKLNLIASHIYSKLGNC